MFKAMAFNMFKLNSNGEKNKRVLAYVLETLKLKENAR